MVNDTHLYIAVNQVLGVNELQPSQLVKRMVKCKKKEI
jgi:hypothetical protein